MKTLMAILLSFIISEAPVLAIHGGYTLGGAIPLSGTYAGVLIPTSDTVLPPPVTTTTTTTTTGTTATTTSAPVGFGTNSLGLFTLGLPTTGIGSGTVVIFSSSQQLSGTIMAIPDPNSSSGVLGVITATGEVTTAAFTDNFLGLNENLTTTQLTGDASGSLVATVSQGVVSDSPYGINLNGTSNMTISTASTDVNGNTVLTPTENITFAVDGFLQSFVVTATAAATTTTTAGN
jgi:hypothetical protein